MARLAVAIGVPLLTWTTSGAAAPSISLPASVIPEGDDFATRVLGLPWDMTAGPYPDFATVFFGVERSSFTSVDGLWTFRTSSNDPSLHLLSPGIEETQSILKLGDRYPIDASRYRLLSFRLCSSAPSSANVHWFYDQFPPSAFASSRFISIAATSGSNCAVYVIDMTQIGVAESFGGASGWTGLIRGLRLDPINTGSGVSVQLDWVRLTTAEASPTVPINWLNADSGANLFFYLGKGSACSTAGATLIGRTPRTGSSGTFTWGSVLQPNPALGTPLPPPASFQAGQYAVIMLVDNTGPPICAGTPLDIRKAPLLSFQKPSFFSGPDYATQAVGDAWDMSNAADVSAVTNIPAFDFAGGVFNGLTNATADVNYRLRTTAPIDTHRYKYLTFRMLLDGIQDIGAGWVHRFVWWYQGTPMNTTVTKDMIIYEGWQTYSIDLSQALIEESSLGPGWVGTPAFFRMNANEVSAPTTFHVDFVTLTGAERVQSGAPFPIYYEAAGAGATVTLFRDTDKSSTVGRAALAVFPSACPTPSPVYQSLLTGTCVLWDTAGVPAGTYFISADVSDGITTTSWYSEMPVVVTPSRPAPARSDFDGDGLADILWRSTAGDLRLWVMNGASLSGNLDLGNVSTAWTITAIADFDGDGKADILWRHASGATVLWLMTGAIASAVVPLGSVPTSWRVDQAGDFDGDGNADILWRDTAGAVVIWFMDGGTIKAQVSLGTVSTAWTVAGVGDFEGDHHADILWRHASGNVVLWQMTAGRVTANTPLGNVDSAWSIAGVGDMDDDGRTDILWRSGDGEVALWLMIGGSVKSSVGAGNAASAWTIVEVADYDGDGKADILWRHISGGVAVWFMNGGSVISADGLGPVSTVWTTQ